MRREAKLEIRDTIYVVNPFLQIDEKAKKMLPVANPRDAFQSVSGKDKNAVNDMISTLAENLCAKKSLEQKSPLKLRNEFPKK